MRLLIAICVSLALVACSDGTGSASGVSGGALGSSSNQDLGVTDTSTLPTTGQASYSGVMSLNLPQTDASRAIYTGALGLAVDFGQASGQLTGSATDFRGPSGSLLQGRVFVTNGTLSIGVDVATEYSFEAGLSGTLSGDGLRNSVLIGDIDGDFLGQDGSSVTGVLHGDVITVTGVDIFDGTLAADKN